MLTPQCRQPSKCRLLTVHRVTLRAPAPLRIWLDKDKCLAIHHCISDEGQGLVHRQRRRHPAGRSSPIRPIEQRVPRAGIPRRRPDALPNGRPGHGWNRRRSRRSLHPRRLLPRRKRHETRVGTRIRRALNWRWPPLRVGPPRRAATARSHVVARDNLGGHRGRARKRVQQNDVPRRVGRQPQNPTPATGQLALLRRGPSDDTRIPKRDEALEPHRQTQRGEGSLPGAISIGQRGRAVVDLSRIRHGVELVRRVHTRLALARIRRITQGAPKPLDVWGRGPWRIRGPQPAAEKNLLDGLVKRRFGRSPGCGELATPVTPILTQPQRVQRKLQRSLHGRSPDLKPLREGPESRHCLRFCPKRLKKHRAGTHADEGEQVLETIAIATLDRAVQVTLHPSPRERRSRRLTPRSPEVGPADLSHLTRRAPPPRGLHRIDQLRLHQPLDDRIPVVEDPVMVDEARLPPRPPESGGLTRSDHRRHTRSRGRSRGPRRRQR